MKKSLSQKKKIEVIKKKVEVVKKRLKSWKKWKSWKKIDEKYEVALTGLHSLGLK